MKPEAENKKLIELLDFKTAIAVVICLLTSQHIPIIQYMAACFATILCVQDNAKSSIKTGLVRIVVTLIGGIIGILIVLLDNHIQKSWFFILMVGIGVIITFLICKIFKLPNIPSRIGCITVILVVMIMDGEKRVEYAALRLLGTVYGAFVALLVSWGLSLFAKLSFFHFLPVFRSKAQ